jgi:hypothetical protein
MKFRLVLNLRPYRHQKLLSIIDTIPRMERGEFLLDLAEEALRIQTQSEPFQTNCESRRLHLLLRRLRIQ